MKKAMMLCVVSIFALGLVACGPSVEDAFDDVTETAPSFCKNYCDQQVDCTFDNIDYTGDADLEDGFYDKRVEECVVKCSHPAAIGGYVLEYDKVDKEYEIVEHYSGSVYEALGKCIDALELWECDADGSGGHFFYLDFATDEDDCEDVNVCLEDHMGDYSDIECEWNDDFPGNEYCECDADQWPQDLPIPGL